MFAKMKKMTACALAACALCLALAPGIAWAGEAPGVVLDEGASNGSVDVSLVVPKGGDEVRALKLSLTVKGEGGEALGPGSASRRRSRAPRWRRCASSRWTVASA